MTAVNDAAHSFFLTGASGRAYSVVVGRSCDGGGVREL